MRLYVATSNPGKLRDFAHAAAAFPQVEIVPLPGLGYISAPEEDADTFLGNALIKARAYSQLAPGEIVLADDSGISVPALDGAPGVRSARYAEDEGFLYEGTTDQRNLACLLDRTAHLTGDARAAHYTCVLAAVRDGELLATGNGTLHGLLLTTPRGDHGFGYDPIFLIPSLDLTMAEIDPDTRLRLSHRGQALVDLLESAGPLKSTAPTLSKEQFRKQQNWFTMAEMPLLLMAALSALSLLVSAFQLNLKDALENLGILAILLVLWRRMKLRIWAARSVVVVAVLVLLLGALLALNVVETHDPGTAVVSFLFGALCLFAGILGLIGIRHHLKLLRVAKIAQNNR